MLRLPECRIEHLDLSFNLLHSDGINDLCKVFLKPNETMSNSLLSLELGSNNIESGGMRHLCKALMTATFCLQHLNLSQNFLHYSGCKILVDALIVNTTVRTLALASNFIKDEGAECMSFLLGLETCQLEQLDISDNFICQRGALAILSVFSDEGDRQLKKLDLRKNETEELSE